MRASYVLGAQLSKIFYGSKGSFKRQLNNLPTTAFQYYYWSKLKELCKYSEGFVDSDLLSCGQQSNTFRRYIRKEWDLLSASKKRLYYAFFFHFTKIDYKALKKYELARILEIPTPAISEYMLFRNKFKHKYDTICFQERKERLKKRSIMAGHAISISIRNSHEKESRLNLTKRFQKMCRECRLVWNKKISNEQKDEIRTKWELEKQQFDLQLARELEALSFNLNRLLKMNVDARAKTLQINRHKTSTMATNVIIPYGFHKKK
ncbi:hypothetical protein HG536_0D03240 [Torulaspora globosa]|uniref:Uncharacterized protein n=1 Tax=Torulaspora globosa TaxID=48254 RepID=A0A7G3ZH16_9SACH|nr:uncharacterized protein HG536_0D03240 [Torulaspora globosa]QLL32802.1 hypothetical protein HG536_0D03240 [Torulaspora globosa]